MEHKFLSAETAKALDTIRKIMESFPEYGVVDLFGMYSPKDVLLSIVALSRLQRVLEDHEHRHGIASDDDGNLDGDDRLLRELAHYSKWANAAYGWKGGLLSFRLHFGNNRALMKRTGILKRDIVAANWHSKANRPVSVALGAMEIVSSGSLQ